MKKVLSRVLALAGVVWLVVAVAAGAPAPIGSLVGSKNATLDGQAPLPHTVLLSGDNLQVKEGLAMVTLERGNRMTLGRESDASFSKEANGVKVSLTRGELFLYHPAVGVVFRVKIGDVTVRPPQGHRTLADIAMAPGVLLVTVKDGVLQVEKAGTTKEVRKGSTMTIPATAAQARASILAQTRPVRHIVVRRMFDFLEVAGGGAATSLATIALTRSSKQVSPVTPTP